MKAGDLVWIYFSGPDAIYALGRAIGDPYYFGSWRVDLMWEQRATRRLMQDPIPKRTFGQPVYNVRRANPHTADVLDRWIRANKISMSSLLDDGSQDNLSDDEDARRRVIAKVVRRQGQAAFRAELLIAYGGRCAISGSTTVQVLEAAHIRPYRGVASNAVNNGVLLRSDLHALFDLRLLSVDQSGRVMISGQLRGSDYWALQNQALRMPKSKRAYPSQRLLAKHRASFVP